MRRFSVMIMLGICLCVIIFLTGCGETFSGMGKDIRRIGRGAKTVVFRDE